MTNVKPKGWLYSIDDMTKEKVKELDSQYDPPAWLSDSWLCLMGYLIDGTQDGIDKHEFCEYLWNLKIAMRDDGYVFNIDKLC